MTTTGRVPNLLIVGVAKAGTTSLFHYLGQHPDVCPSDIKELRYFSPIEIGQPLAPLAAYTGHFEACEQQKYAMEATPGYFYGGEPLARRIDSTCDDARLILVFRSPTERCWSFFRFVKARLRLSQEMSFSSYLDRCEELHAAGRDLAPENADFSGMVKGCYSRWLPSWTSIFGERLEILFFERLVQDPRSSVRALCEWLDIDPGAADNFRFSADNTTERYQYRWLHAAAVATHRRGHALLERHRLSARLLRNAYYSLNGSRTTEQLQPEERRRLDEFYRPYIAELAVQLNARGIQLPATW